MLAPMFVSMGAGTVPAPGMLVRSALGTRLWLVLGVVGPYAGGMVVQVRRAGHISAGTWVPPSTRTQCGCYGNLPLQYLCMYANGRQGHYLVAPGPACPPMPPLVAHMHAQATKQA